MHCYCPGVIGYDSGNMDIFVGTNAICAIFLGKKWALGFMWIVFGNVNFSTFTSRPSTIATFHCWNRFRNIRL